MRVKTEVRRINTYIGASCMLIMLEAIWPSLRYYHNALPTSAGVTSNKLIAYFVFWIRKLGHLPFISLTRLVQLPLVLIHPRKMRWLFFVKSIVAVVAAFAILGWAVHTAGGGGLCETRHCQGIGKIVGMGRGHQHRHLRQDYSGYQHGRSGEPWSRPISLTSPAGPHSIRA